MEEKLRELAQKHQFPLNLLQEIIAYETEKVILQKRKIDPILILLEKYAEQADQYIIPKPRKAKNTEKSLHTLKLQRISLKNWRCYRQQVLKFDLHKNQNIWIIFGNNGYGKTSLLEAMVWCLYGNEFISINELEKSFHRVEIKENPELEIVVQMTFQGDGRYYQIQRVARRVKKGNHYQTVVDEVMVNIDGQQRPDGKEYIESILPKSCKEFFFFDGVKIENYAEMTQTKESRQAIERILGIPELKNLRDDVQRALKTLEKKLSESAKLNQDLQQVTTKLRKKQDDIDLTKDQLQEKRREYDSSIKIMQGLKENAHQISDLQGKLEKLKKQENQQKTIENYLKKLEDQIDQALRKSPISLMLDFVKELADDLQRKSLTSARRSGSVAELQRLIDADLCLCGRCIDDEIRTYIKQQLALIETSGDLTQEAIYQDNVRDNLLLVSRYEPTDLNNLLLERDRYQEILEEVKQVITHLKTDTAGINQQEASEIWKKIGNQEGKVEENKTGIYTLEKRIDALEKEAKDLVRERENLANHSRETANLSKQILLAQGIFNAANELIEWYIEQRQQIIEQKTTEIHSLITNKPEEYVGIKINSDYTLGVENIRGEIIKPEGLSAGEKEALAFAFITGLNLASGMAAPLIMDTPFGHLDLCHQKNIINCLPELPSQVILLATDRDFPEHLLSDLKPNVAEFFAIHRREGSEDASLIEREF